MKTKFLHSLGSLFGLFLFTVALWVLHHELAAYHLHDIVQNLAELPAHRLFIAVLLTILCYFISTGYDALALRYLHHPLGYPKIALASFIGYAFSNNIGFSMLAGATVRYRIYSAWEFSALEITKVIAFCSLTVWLGFLTLAGVVFILEPLAIPEALHLPFVSVRPLGIIFIALVALFLLLSILRKKPLKFRHREFTLPSIGVLLVQISVASLDWALAGSVFYVLMPALSKLSYPGVLGIFLLAQIAGISSQLPGGIGVFETVSILLLSPILPASAVMGSLLAYRGVYYLLPLLTASVLLGTQEVLRKKEGARRIVQFFGQWVSGVVPPVLAFTTFLGGTILLFSGTTPAVSRRLAWLKGFIPLPAMEVSHFLGSMAGVGLLFLARGLHRRLDAAYILTAALLGAGILFSLLKGLDYEEAIILSVMLLSLLPCRPYFYRKASLICQRFSFGWTAAIMLVLFCTVWLGRFSYKHVKYSNDLWWQFTLSGDAPRSLRAMVGAISFVLFLGIAKLLRPAPPEPEPPGPKDLRAVLPIVQKLPKTCANLALLGDKSFLLSRAENAFVMYRVDGRSWVAMGDPIGPAEEWPDLIWRFREMCDRFDGWPVFYAVGPENLHLYLDLGLTLLKLGEEARVPLETLSLQGPTQKALRQTCRKLEREGAPLS